MPVKDPSNTQLNGLPGTRSALGLLWQAKGTFPSFSAIMAMLWHLTRVLEPLAALKVVESSTAANAVYVMAGRCSIDGVALAWAGGDVLALANNDTTYVWAEKSGSTVVIATAIDGVGWPAPEVDHIKLAEVTLSAGVITSIIDRRVELWLRSS